MGGLERSISDLESVIEESKEGIATFSDEINSLKTSVSELDKQVADATEQRKAESVEFKDLMKSNTAAKEVILFAKNRLNKFTIPHSIRPRQRGSSRKATRSTRTTAGTFPPRPLEASPTLASRPWCRCRDVGMLLLHRPLQLLRTRRKEAKAEASLR